jgi:hypothetical protein
MSVRNAPRAYYQAAVNAVTAMSMRDCNFEKHPFRGAGAVPPTVHLMPPRWVRKGMISKKQF